MESQDDQIEGSMLGKRRILKIIDNVVDYKKEYEKENADESPISDLPDDLDEYLAGIQDEIIRSEAVAVFLTRDDVIWNFFKMLHWGKILRLKELVLAILGNMAAYEVPRKTITENDIGKLAFNQLLYSRDARILFEAGRLLRACISKDDSRNEWMTRLRDNLDDFVDTCMAVLGNCQKEETIRTFTKLVQDLVDQDQVFLGKVNNWNFVEAMLPATEQLLEEGEFESFTYIWRAFHIIHTVIVAMGEKINIPENIHKSLLKQLNTFANTCQTTRVYYKDYDRNGPTEGRSSAQVATACCLQLAQISMVDHEHKENSQDDDDDDQDKGNCCGNIEEYHKELTRFAQKVADADGILHDLEVYFPDGSPWSDCCYQNRDAKNTPSEYEQELKDHAQEVIDASLHGVRRRSVSKEV